MKASHFSNKCHIDLLCKTDIFLTTYSLIIRLIQKCNPSLNFLHFHICKSDIMEDTVLIEVHKYQILYQLIQCYFSVTSNNRGNK